MEQLDVKMVGASDASGAIRSEKGIDAEALAEHVSKGGTLRDFDGVEAIDPDDLLEVECEVFIPAALGGMIHKHNASRLSPQGGGGANSPTTPPPTRSCKTRASSWCRT